MVKKRRIIRRIRRIVRRTSARRSPRVLKAKAPRVQKSPGAVKSVSGAAKKSDILKRYQEELKTDDKGWRKT